MSNQQISGNDFSIEWSDLQLLTSKEGAAIFREKFAPSEPFQIMLRFGPSPIERKLQRLYTRQCHRWAILRVNRR